MTAFDNNWETLGYHRGEIDFYTIDMSLFGGWRYAFPEDCIPALEGGRFDNPLTCPNRGTSVQWFLRRFVAAQGGGAVTTLASANKPIEGTASASTGGCVEHAVHWPAVGGKHMPASGRAKRAQIEALADSGATFFAAQSTIIIYATWQPCMSCCNSLWSLAREHGLDINLIVRFQRVYDFDTAGPLADATILIPRVGSIVSAANPAPADRAVFVLHDGVNELRNVNNIRHRGEMRPIVVRGTQMSPHGTNTVSNDHPGGVPCGGTTFDAVMDWQSTAPQGYCHACVKRVPIYGTGSGLPWVTLEPERVCDGYTAPQHYDGRRLRR